MKKLLALLLVLFNLTASALAADIPYLDRVQPEYRDAAQGYVIDVSSYAQVDKRNNSFVPAPSDIERETIYAENIYEHNQIPMYIYRPANAGNKPLPVVYYSHGGGYLFRISLEARDRYQNIADATGAAVVTPKYRLSVEAPFPAALTDTYSGLLYIKQNAKTLGLDGDKIVLMGDSAGGGLSASLALYNRDNANIPLKGQALIYPMLDYRTATDASPYTTKQTGYICWPRTSNVFAWQVLRGGQTIGEDMMPYFSPAMAQDVSSLPPALIYVGGLDLFVNEDIAYAGKLADANVDTELHVIPGLYHAFEIANPNGAASHEFWQCVYDFTNECFAK